MNGFENQIFKEISHIHRTYYIRKRNFQIDPSRQHLTIRFISRTLKDREKRHHTTERKLLAIVFGCKKCRNYVLGYKTNGLMDHRALTFLNSCRV